MPGPARELPTRILVVRNDKLGDFTLALPTFALLKRALPEARIAVLVPEYTRAVAELSPAIDDVVIDPGADAGVAALAERLRSGHFDAAIVLWSTARVGWATLRAGIPWRLAPATKAVRLLYRRTLVQRRSRSVKPEFEYNLDLARSFLAAHGVAAEFPIERPLLALDADAVARRRAELVREHALDAHQRLVLVHSGSGGSANNLGLEAYARLLEHMDPERELGFLMTAGPGEEERARSLAARLEGWRCGVHVSSRGLAAFVEVLATADLFVGGSTGPLHLAGALDRPTVAFYPRRSTSSPLRWRTLNSEGRYLGFAPPEGAHERDMSAIDLQAVAEKVRGWM